MKNNTPVIEQHFVKSYRIFGFLLLCMFLVLTGCNGLSEKKESKSQKETRYFDEVPSFNQEPYIAIDNNEPGFSEDEITDKSFESYSQLDRQGRCGVALACVGRDIMPTKKEEALEK